MARALPFLSRRFSKVLAASLGVSRRVHTHGGSFPDAADKYLGQEERVALRKTLAKVERMLVGD